ncbi:MAG: ArnT family glycosyltransferase [Dysgonomonas sp.]
MGQNIRQAFSETFINNKYNLILLGIYAFVLLFFCSEMSPLYPINTWADVNIYFNVGKCIFEGRTLYTEAFDHKGPLIFFIYGIGYLISNTSFLGMFIIEVVAWIIMLYAIYYSAKLFIDRSLAFIVALVFPLFLFKYTMSGGSAEEFVLVFETVSLYFFLRYFKDKEAACHDPRFMLIHGIMSSMAFFIKLNLIFFWFFPLLGIFINLILTKKYRNLITNLLAYLGGFLIIMLPICLYMIINDSLEKSYFIYIVTNSKYASIPESATGIIMLLLNRIYIFFRSDVLGSVSICLGIFYFPVKFIKNRIGRLSFILCGISVFVIVSFTRSFFGYYNLPFYVFNTLGWIAVLHYLQQFASVTNWKKATTVLFFIAVLFGINEKKFFDIGGEVFFNKKKATGLIFQFGEEINKEQNPTLLNLGFGYGNGVFTFCDIKPNVTYFITPNLPHYLYPEMRDEQTNYIKNKSVDFVILTNVTQNYEYFDSLSVFKNNYMPIDTFVDYSDVNKIPPPATLEQAFPVYYLFKRKD